jgi:cytochrome d ubiquinol oxidase subunit II
VITIVALIFTPLMLLFQGWTYYVFRKRLGGEPIGTATTAAAGSGRPAAT